MLIRQPCRVLELFPIWVESTYLKLRLVSKVSHMPRAARRKIWEYLGDILTHSKASQPFFRVFRTMCSIFGALFQYRVQRWCCLTKSSDARKLPKYPEIDPRDPRNIVEYFSFFFFCFNNFPHYRARITPESTASQRGCNYAHRPGNSATLEPRWEWAPAENYSLLDPHHSCTDHVHIPILSLRGQIPGECCGKGPRPGH
jgi:hypothetical protein